MPNISKVSSEDAIAHLLETNQRPSESEVVQIRQVIQQAESEVSQLNTQITQINTRIKKYKSLLAPDRRLPADVVAEIFLACVDNVVNSWSFPTARGVTTSLLLAQICSTWRTVAFSTARMWVCLCLDTSRMSEESACVLAKYWFARSGEALPLEFNCLGSSASTELLGIVRAYAPRWKGLYLITSMTSLHSLSQVPVDSFPLLEILALVFVRDTPISGVTIFSNTPSLRRVHLPAPEPPGGSEEIWFSQPVLPWHQLTHYQSDHTSSVGDALQQMSLCPNLIECRMTIVGLRRVIVMPVRLPQLRLLHLKSPGWTWSFLDNLSLPVLQEFKFKCLMIGSPAWPQGLSQMIRQSVCSIERFTMHNILSTPEEFMETLYLMPELQKLELIQEPDWTFHTLQRPLNENGVVSLTDRGQPSGELPLPKLQTLKMNGDFLLETSLLVDLVQSRWDLREEGRGPKPSARLKTAWIPVQVSELGGSLIDKLERMKEEGLDVVIVPYNPVIMTPGLEFT